MARAPDLDPAVSRHRSAPDRSHGDDLRGYRVAGHPYEAPLNWWSASWMSPFCRARVDLRPYARVPYMRAVGEPGRCPSSIDSVALRVKGVFTPRRYQGQVAEGCL